MLKINIPIEEDILDSAAVLLKSGFKPQERQKLNMVVEKIKQEGVAEVKMEFVEQIEADTQVGIALMAIASNVPEE